jgi:hypothetical protein
MYPPCAIFELYYNGTGTLAAVMKLIGQKICLFIDIEEVNWPVYKEN